jgi:hypothetical protein
MPQKEQLLTIIQPPKIFTERSFNLIVNTANLFALDIDNQQHIHPTTINFVSSTNTPIFENYNYLTKLIEFCRYFTIVQLNINSITKHLYDVTKILDTGKYDILCFNESKLDETIPITFFKHNSYQSIRNDRNRHGGGTIVFIKKSHVVSNIQTKSIVCDIEFVLFSIRIFSTNINFICSYKPPCDHNVHYIDSLDNLIQLLNLDDPLFIVGDLNMDLSDANTEDTDFKDFLTNNDLINYVKDYTRVVTRYIVAQNSFITSKTLIDVILHNSDLVVETSVIDCPFSDHKFVAANIKICRAANSSSTTIRSRCLTESKLEVVTAAINSTNFSTVNSIVNVDSRWLSLKSSLTEILDHHAPYKDIKVPQINNTPWVDHELRQVRSARDCAYKRSKLTSLNSDHTLFIHLKSSFLEKQKQKMIEYFKQKKNNDFN